MSISSKLSDLHILPAATEALLTSTGDDLYEEWDLLH